MNRRVLGCCSLFLLIAFPRSAAIAAEPHTQTAPPLRFLFPQIGNGAGFRTALVFYNIGEATTIRVELYQSDGTPLSLALDGLGSGSVFSVPLGRGEAFSTQTSGSGPLVAGYAQVFGPQAIGGTAIFTLSSEDGSRMFFEAGVPATQPARDFSVYFDTRGNRETGLALVNPRPVNGSSPARVTLRLYDPNFRLQTQRVLDLAAGSHIANYIDTLLPVGNLREGSLTVQADRPLAAVTLRQTLQPEPGPTLTAFPAIPGRADQSVAAVGGNAPNVFFFPQIGDGVGGSIRFQTTLILVNTAADTMARVEFFDSSGAPLALRLGALGTASSFDIPLARGASFSAQTAGTQPLRAGYARITTQAGVGGTAVFTRSTPSGILLYEAGVASATPLTDFSLVSDSRGFRDTGLALVNAGSASPAGSLGAQPAVTLHLYDRLFRPLGEVSWALPAGGHRAEFVSQIFAGAGFERELGSVTASSPTGLAALTLRQTDRPGIDYPDEIPTLAAFPVIAGRADGGNSDLSILKTGPVSANAQSILDYTIRVSNAGPDLAPNLVMTDTLPAGVEFVAASGTGWICTFASGSVVCRRPELGAGLAAPPVTIAARAPASTGSVNNSASVVSDATDSNTGNNQSNASTNILPPATDLAVSVSGESSTSAGSGPLDYTVTVTNTSGSPAANVTLTGSFVVCTRQGVSPSQCQDLGVPLLEVLSVALLDPAPGRSCARNGANFSCTLDSLAGGTTVRAAVRLDFDNAVFGRSILSSSSVAGGSDPNPANNTARLVTDVFPTFPEVDLAVSKTAQPNPASPGGMLTYTLTVTNSGGAVASQVVLEDELPPNVNFIRAMIGPSSARCSNLNKSCSPVGGGAGVTCSLGAMCPGNVETVTILVSVPQTAAGTTLTNRATVGSQGGETELNPGDNQTQLNTPVSN